jgi:hypothetical protein
MKNYNLLMLSETSKLRAAALVATLALFGCSGSKPLKSEASTTTTSVSTPTQTALEQELERSRFAQPLVVESCPKGGRTMRLGSLVQADLLGLNSLGHNAVIIGDAAKDPIKEYESNGEIKAWCGPVSDEMDPITGLFSPDKNRHLNITLLIPAWPGCNIPKRGEVFMCAGSPLVLDSGDIASTVPSGTPLVPTTGETI